MVLSRAISLPGQNDTHGSVDTKQKIFEKLASKDLTFFKTWCIIKVQKRKELINMTKAIYFDMDGTIANFYGVPNWLDSLIASDPTPYRVAQPLVNMNSLARLLNHLQADGWHIGIVSWLSKSGTAEFNEVVTATKVEWLNRHLHSVNWNEVVIVPYGTPKQEVVQFATGILFDDETPNRTNWTGTAYDVQNIIEILKGLR
jgi:hypothetical protein